MSRQKSNKPVKQKAGAIVFRQSAGGQVEILAITARRYPGAWIFPVGSVKRGETLAEAAARECVEESGYQVEIGPLLATVELAQGDSIHRFTFFAARVAGRAEVYETDRQQQWLSPAGLVETITPVFRPAATAAVAYAAKI